MTNVSDHLPDSLATITELVDIPGSLNRNAAIEALSENLLLEISDLCLPKDEHIDPWCLSMRRIRSICMMRSIR